MRRVPGSFCELQSRQNKKMSAHIYAFREPTHRTETVLASDWEDLWICDHFSENSKLASALALVHAKSAQGKFKEAIALVVLKTGYVLLGLVQYSGASLPSAIEAVASTIADLHEEDVRSNDVLAVAIEDRHGFHLSFLNAVPEQAIQSYISDWRHRRLVELSQVKPQPRLNELRERVDRECVDLGDRFNAAISALRNRYSVSPIEIEDKLPHLTWVEVHNYLCARNLMVARNRRQALALFPLFSALAIRSDESRSFGEGLRSVIDEGLPLIDYVVARWDVKPVAVKAIRCLGFDEVGLAWTGALRPLVYILSGLAPEKYPKSKEQWTVFWEQASTIAAVLKLPLGAESIRLLMNGLSRRKWRKSVNLEVTLIEQVRVFESFSADLVRLASVWIDVELMEADESSQEAGLHLILSSKLVSFGLEQCLRMAMDWQALRADLARRLEVRKVQFPCLMESPYHCDDLQIVQLRSVQDLNEESGVMNHCVDTYFTACQSGRSVILSVRQANGTRLSTFEISIKRKGLSLFDVTLVQQKGRSNVYPSAEAVGAVRAFMKYLNGIDGLPLLHRFSREKQLFNHAPERVKDIQVAEHMQEFIVAKTGGRIDFNKLPGARSMSLPASYDLPDRYG